MNKFIIIFILFLPFNLYSQNGTKSSTDYRDKLTDIVIFDSSITRDINKTAFEIFVTLYSDSINNATSYKMLPQFLKDSNFDYHHSNFWFPPQSEISLRNIIMLRTCNCLTLKFIITDKTNLYKKRPNRVYKVNLSNLSFYDLSIERYRSLECDR